MRHVAVVPVKLCTISPISTNLTEAGEGAAAETTAYPTLLAPGTWQQPGSLAT